ncbi:tyrosine-type recombinase/integrase [archaeon]|nr:tyrosine-type recombinase/integrase [archaeon]
MDPNELIRKEAMRRGLSPRTIKTYKYCVEQFFKKNKDKDPRQITKKDVREFLDDLIEKDKPGNTINVYNNSLKFFFEECLGKRMKLNIKYSKKPRRLPTVLTQQEIKLLINSIENEKHKLMIQLLYSSGMRVSELTNLKVQDIEGNYGWVREGKGMKDRPFILADKISNKIKDICNNKKSEEYIFQSYKGKMSTRTIQVIIKKATKKARITKNVHPHTLRHSFATHLIENGYAVSEVQSLLGHASLDTTMIYVHLARPNLINVKSPLDEL